MAYTSFMRGDNTKMTNTPYTDGLIFLNTEEQALYLDDNNERIPMGGAGTGGHIIENNAGTDMTERANLQFGGVYVSDDETNDRTKVNVTRNMSKDDFDQLTTAEKLGVIVTSNDPNDYVPFSADMVEYDNTNSGMTATDVQDAIDELKTDMTIDLSDTSLPSSTTFNALIQMMAEKLYPSKIWDAIDDPTILLTKGYQNSYTAPTVTKSGNTLNMVSNSSDGIGWVYVLARTNSYNIHIKGTAIFGTSKNEGLQFEIDDSISAGGTASGNTTLQSLNDSGSFEYNLVIPANKIFSLNFDGINAGGITATITEFYAY